MGAGEITHPGVVEAAFGVRGDQRQAAELVERIERGAEPCQNSVHRLLR